MSPVNRVALCCLLALPGLSFAQYQTAAPAPAEYPEEQPQATAPTPVLSPQELDNLVAPVALYPDPLLGQVLSASTYPLEIVEAQQWLQQNSNLRGEQLMQAARQQQWDPSVQALVAFPDVVRTLSSNVRWTTDLGNAFLAQESDVMSAVQRMRGKARANGRLSTNQQQVVSEEPIDDGSQAIMIEPADPQVIYVPAYDPAYVWGPPVWGYYPSVWYPGGFGFGFGFGRGVYMSSFFGGWGGWNSWGWGFNWRNRGLFLNTGFYNRYGFRGHYGGYGSAFAGRGFRSYGGGRVSWSHDPSHRSGVPYPNRNIAGRFHSDRFAGGGSGGRQYGGGARMNRSYDSGRQSSGFAQSPRGGQGGQNWRRFGDSGGSPSSVAPQTRGSRQYGNPGQRTYASPSGQSFSSPRSNGWSNNPSGSRPQARESFRQNGSSGQRTYASPSGQSFSSPRSNGWSNNPSGSRPQARDSFRQNGSSGQRTYSSPPARSFSSPRSSGGFNQGSTPRSQNYSAPRIQSMPQQNYSAPRSFSSPNRGSMGHSESRGASSGSHGGGGSQSRSSGGSGGGGHSHRR